MTDGDLSHPQAALLTEQAVRALLDDIIDPCSSNAGAPAGLNTMGLVRSVTITRVDSELADVEVVLGLTEPGCLMGWAFLREAEERLPRLASIRAATVRLDTRTLWTPEDLDPEYRVKLAAARRASVQVLKQHPSRRAASQSSEPLTTASSSSGARP